MISDETHSSHWQETSLDEAVPADLVEIGGLAPRYRCTEDGTRVYTLADVAAHDEHFHAKATGGPAAPGPADAYLRAEALGRAVEAGLGVNGADELARASATLVAFLRDGTTQTDPHLGGPKALPGGIDVLEHLISFIARSTFEDASGLRSLEGQDAQDHARSYLTKLGFEQLRMMAHVAVAARALVIAELNRRTQ